MLFQEKHFDKRFNEVIYWPFSISLMCEEKRDFVRLMFPRTFKTPMFELKQNSKCAEYRRSFVAIIEQFCFCFPDNDLTPSRLLCCTQIFLCNHMVGVYSARSIPVSVLVTNMFVLVPCKKGWLNKPRCKLTQQLYVSRNWTNSIQCWENRIFLSSRWLV